MGELFDPFDLERNTPKAPVLAVIVDDWGGYDTKAAAPPAGISFSLNDRGSTRPCPFAAAERKGGRGGTRSDPPSAHGTARG